MRLLLSAWCCYLAKSVDTFLCVDMQLEAVQAGQGLRYSAADGATLNFKQVCRNFDTPHSSFLKHLLRIIKASTP